VSSRPRAQAAGITCLGEKSLVLRGLDASQLIVAAQAADGPALFRRCAAKGVERRAEPAMGLKASGTARVRLNGVKVAAERRLAAPDFDFQAFLDLSGLAWCALAWAPRRRRWIT
jgi:alkylation response protein AidB-like acyl-CoA dehydrogenase